ncbi:MAG: M48 family metalloprotease [Alphaproteobacteria bacterium]|nr:M48 family metalloprotease [Alphaproteobacteria bacterium]
MNATPKVLTSLALASSLALTSACTQVVNPATGQNEYTAMSPAQEKAVGKDQHPKILQQFGGEYDDPDLRAYVDRIGDRLQAVSELPDLDFTFTLLNSDVVNAFALPGGYVYISRGLLALAENEAEVAGVMAHEVGHVTARHSAQRYSRGVLAQGGVTLGAVLAGVLGGGNLAKTVQEIGGTGAQAYLAGYSREQEFQSDELGVRYLTRAGYDPVAMATFLEKLGEHSELARKLAGKEDAPDPSTSMFATHPRTPDRVRRAAENAAKTEAKSGKIGRDEYLQRIDGMIYGDDPSQGFIRGRTFVHPELRFAFEAPEGFRLQNTPSAVVGGDKAGNGMKFDAAKMRSANMRDYMAKEWAKELKIQNLKQINSFDLDGLPAVSAGTTGKTKDGQSVDVGLAAIQVDADRVYRFMFLSPGGANQAEARAAQDTVESFRVLSDAEAARYQPKRIKVVRAKPGDSTASLARRMAVDDLPELQFEVLNGLDQGEQPTGGALVKLIAQ